jgi:DNA-binding response OmpR family regulator
MVEVIARTLTRAKGVGAFEVLIRSDGSWQLNIAPAGDDSMIVAATGQVERDDGAAPASLTIKPGNDEALRVGPLTLCPKSRAVRVNGYVVETITRMEWQLLHVLAQEPVRVFTKAELLRDVWGFKHLSRSRTLDSHAVRLRKKLAEAGLPGYIINVWGVGYRLTNPTLIPTDGLEAVAA